jgi:streptomycin 6-kinase
MSDRRVQIPDLVRQKVTYLGLPGEEWLAELPGLIAHLERAWSITVGQPLVGGTAAYVAHARTANGQDAVLKVAIPGESMDDQMRTVAAAGGRGYALLLASDPERHAMLLEALGPPMATLGLTPERAIELLCQTLREAWQIPRPVGLTVTPDTEKATRLARFVQSSWERLGRPCSERVVSLALEYAHSRAAAFDLDRCVVVHGDPHPWNALQVLSPRVGAESGFVFVDPDGFLAEPAYDLGVVLRDWSAQLLAGDARALARRYCALLSAHTGIEETTIWEWGYLERVSTGLYASEVGLLELGRPLLRAAELLV